MTFDGFAPAKINLTLHVTGQRADGYHLLDSIVVFADVGDRLKFTPRDHLSLSVTGPFADGVPQDAGNLVWKAAVMAGQTAHITVEKNLPNGAGIGGGSSDAAAVLRHFGHVTGAGDLGADVPVCLAASAQRMRGIGDVLDPVPGFAPLPAVLVNPGVHVPTPAVFAALGSKMNPAMPTDIPAFSTPDAMAQWLTHQRNDLEAPALALAPEIGSVLHALRASAGCLLARMSGSGATCFGLYPSSEAAREAAGAIAKAHPNWWCVPTRLS